MYFEDNHDKDKMMEFCNFVKGQAGNTYPLLVHSWQVRYMCVTVCVDMYVCVCTYNIIFWCVYACVCVTRFIWRLFVVSVCGCVYI